MFYWYRGYHGNITTPLRFLPAFFIRISRYQEFVSEIAPLLNVSILAKFEQFHWERFGNILERSPKGPKNSE